MKELTPHLFSFIFPLFTANILHMFIVKYDLFDQLAIPISKIKYGEGKTWRGFVVLTFLTSISALMINWMIHQKFDPFYLFLGAALGFTYALAELPNSYIKRKIGIASGQSHPKFKFIQFLIDKLDSLLLLGIVYYFLTKISLLTLSLVLLISFLLHIIFSFLLFLFKVKKNI